jgi:flagellar hook-length control protein FliK
MVKMKVDNGKLKAEIDVSNASTKTMLEANISQLQTTLTSRGIDLQHIDIVSADQTGLGTSDGHQGTKEQKSKQTYHGDNELTQDDSSHDYGYNTMELTI